MRSAPVAHMTASVNFDVVSKQIDLEDLKCTLRDRTRVCKEFIDFIVTLRSSKQTTRIIDHAYLFDPTISPEHIGDVLIYIICHSFFSLIV